MMTQNTRESALRREDFHKALQVWLDDSFDSRIGDVESHAGPAWLWVRHGGAHYYLSGASTREGIREYMRLVAAADGDPRWSTPGSASAVRERVAVGRERRVIDGFEFFQHLPGR
ncbi:MAG TPA: hypothetical protein VFZ24_07125 [Longimicrobiales bacterium]